jgi:hypothetical protein
MVKSEPADVVVPGLRLTATTVPSMGLTTVAWASLLGHGDVGGGGVDGAW